jgi:hypothetical protein
MRRINGAFSLFTLPGNFFPCAMYFAFPVPDEARHVRCGRQTRLIPFFRSECGVEDTVKIAASRVPKVDRLWVGEVFRRQFLPKL